VANIQARFAIAAVLGLPIFFVALQLGPTAFDLTFHRRQPERFLVPEGYKGWVRIDFRQKDASLLPTEQGRLLLKLAADGTLKTSSNPLAGHGNDDYYYYAGDRRIPLSNRGVCKGGMIWQVETLVDDHTGSPFVRFFVGTEDQYRQVVDPQGKNSPVC
jgi:hypothetical protein